MSDCLCVSRYQLREVVLIVGGEAGDAHNGYTPKHHVCIQVCAIVERVAIFWQVERCTDGRRCTTRIQCKWQTTIQSAILDATDSKLRELELRLTMECSKVEVTAKSCHLAVEHASLLLSNLVLNVLVTQNTVKFGIGSATCITSTILFLVLDQTC